MSSTVQIFHLMIASLRSPARVPRTKAMGQTGMGERRVGRVRGRTSSASPTPPTKGGGESVATLD